MYIYIYCVGIYLPPIKSPNMSTMFGIPSLVVDNHFEKSFGLSKNSLAYFDATDTICASVYGF